MSSSNYIACKTCHECLWIGQGQTCFYFGELTTMKQLKIFLAKHLTFGKDKEHRLLYVWDLFNGPYENDGYTDALYQTKST